MSMFVKWNRFIDLSYNVSHSSRVKKLKSAEQKCLITHYHEIEKKNMCFVTRLRKHTAIRPHVSTRDLISAFSHHGFPKWIACYKPSYLVFIT